jgi:hypothetical protein
MPVAAVLAGMPRLPALVGPVVVAMAALTVVAAVVLVVTALQIQAVVVAVVKEDRLPLLLHQRAARVVRG